MGLGYGLIVLVDGVGGFLPLLSNSAVLGATPSSYSLPIAATESSLIPVGKELGIQVFALDPSAVNGLAISNLVLHHSDLLAVTEEITNLSYGRDTIQGYAVASADLDGDGAAEVVIGSPRAAPGGVVNAGEVRIHHGPDQLSVDVLVSPSLEAEAWFGAELALGDLNGDGTPDLVVGARFETEGGLTGAGAVYLFDGASYGLIARLQSPSPLANAEFSKALTTLDWDGDGHLDIAVGEALADVSGLNSVGRVHVFMGPAFQSVITLENPAPQAGSRFGYALGSGDFDGDGQEELVVAAPYFDAGAGNDNSGAVFLFPALSLFPSFSEFHPLDVDAFFGAAIASADLDRDGNLDLVLAAEFADGNAVDDGVVTILYGPSFSERTQVTSPLLANTVGFGGDVTVGDTNADGYGDLIVGEFYGSVGAETRSGRGWILYGPFFDSWKELLPTTPAAYSFAGRVVACGDIDGNGLANPILAAPFASPGGAINHFAGEVSIFR